MTTVDFLTPQGFCGGVRQAIRRLYAYRNEHPDEAITLFGPIVHNQDVVKAFEKLGIRTLNDLTDPEAALLSIADGTVVFSAHGISDQIVQSARDMGLNVLDLSCPYVLKTRELIKEKLKQGYTIFYIGVKNHPEARAITSISDRIICLSANDPVPETDTPVFVTNQTTLSIHELEQIFKKIKEKYPEAVFSDEICNATRRRQEALLNSDPERYDHLIVIGDFRSNNSKKLYETAKKAGFSSVRQIENAGMLNDEDFSKERILITSGASTPKAVVLQTADRLMSRQKADEFQDLSEKILME